MDFEEFRKLHNAAVQAQNARDNGACEFLGETIKGVVERLPKALGMETLFLRDMEPGFEIRTGMEYDYSDSEPQEYDYGDDTHFYAAIPLNTAVRNLLDGKGKDAPLLLRKLQEEGYAQEKEELSDVLGRMPALAYAAGFDAPRDYPTADRLALGAVKFASPSASTIEFDRAFAHESCPGYEEDFIKGRRQSYRAIRNDNYLVLCLYISNDGRDSALMIRCADKPFPHSEQLGWNMQIEIGDDFDPGTVADFVVRRLAGGKEESDDHPLMRM